jgi:transposase InsO family protein
MKFDFIAAEKAQYPVALLCRALDVSRSGFYASQRQRACARTRRDHQLAATIATIHAESQRRYGSPRVHRELRRRGESVGRKRVARLMRTHGLAARRPKRFVRTTDSRHGLPVAPNVVARDFTAAAANRVWVGDITYVPTREGWLYLAALLDVFSRRVVGWAMASDLSRGLVLEALDMALKGRKTGRGLVHHTDRGSQYASRDYRAALRARGITCSMSRAGDCWDNAMAESFFSTIKCELIHDADFATRTLAARAIEDYIVNFYNCRRLHSSLGYVSPIEFELRKSSKGSMKTAYQPVH